MIATSLIQIVDSDRLRRGTEELTARAYSITFTRQTKAEISAYITNGDGHTFASHAVQNGIDLFTVRKLLGYKAIQQTQRYAHLAPDHMRSAVEQIAQALFAPDMARQVLHRATSAA